jgi:Tfp pilus assembly protein PilF
MDNKSDAGTQSWWQQPLAFAGLVVGVILAYSNSLDTPFTFDDNGAVTANPSIHRLATALSPPPQANGAVGRPLVNLSLAVNYAIGGLNVRGYHVFNAAVHLLAGLVLFGVVRRTLLTARLQEDWSPAATPLAFAVALLWLVHPLQTESVVCVVQRSELLVGLFYLLTLYAVIRGADQAGRISVPSSAAWQQRGWYGLAVASCFLGVASKEVMVTAPLVVLLYDRAFIAGTFGEAWRRRGRLYVGLAASWLLLAWLVLHNARRSGVAGFGLGVSPWHYLLTQCEAIVLYLRLAFWPRPLVLDYGTAVVRSLAVVWPQALMLLALAGATGWALWRKPRWGFLGVWFFAVLAPSSSVVPLVTQTMAEHRMYLSLFPLVALTVLALHRWFGCRGVWWFCPPVAAGMIFITIERNHDYRSLIAIWTDTVEHRPDNPRAHQNLGAALDAAGRTGEAIAEYEAALRLDPNYPDAHVNLANALRQQGRDAEAVDQYEAAISGNGNLPDAHYNLGNIFADQRHYPEAVAQYTEAVHLQPDYASARNNLGNVLLLMHRPAEAISEFEAVLRVEPDSAVTRVNLGLALAFAGRWADAEQQLEHALQIDPNNASARETLEHVRAERENR